jgi:hypothetical protein
MALRAMHRCMVRVFNGFTVEFIATNKEAERFLSLRREQNLRLYAQIQLDLAH